MWIRTQKHHKTRDWYSWFISAIVTDWIDWWIFIMTFPSRTLISVEVPIRISWMSVLQPKSEERFMAFNTVRAHSHWTNEFDQCEPDLVIRSGILKARLHCAKNQHWCSIPIKFGCNPFLKRIAWCINYIVITDANVYTSRAPYWRAVWTDLIDGHVSWLMPSGLFT